MEDLEEVQVECGAFGYAVVVAMVGARVIIRTMELVGFRNLGKKKMSLSRAIDSRDIGLHGSI